MNIPSGLKLRHLEAFLAVAAHGSISAAARARNVSQPALSKTISDLETLLGVPLFERIGRRTLPSPAGETFRVHAQAAMRDLESAVAAFAGGGAGGEVRVGVLPTVAGQFFPSVALEFSQSFDGMRVAVVSGPHDTLVEMLRSGKIDLMVGRMPVAHDMPGLSFEYLYEEPIVLVARADHPARGRPAREAVAHYPLILPNAEAIIRQNVNQYLSRLGISDGAARFETVALPVALALLERSDLLWFISRGVVDRELRSGTLVSLELASGDMIGAIGLTRKFKFDDDSPADRLARLLHRRAAEQAVGPR